MHLLLCLTIALTVAGCGSSSQPASSQPEKKLTGEEFCNAPGCQDTTLKNLR